MMTRMARGAEMDDELIGRLRESSAHFIRCIKPNPRMAPRDFDEAMVQSQLRSLGTLEAVTLMRSGFPSRVPFGLIADRYRRHLERAVPNCSELTPAQVCELLVEIAELGRDDYQMGVTRLFLRAGKGKFFEDLKEKPVEEVLLCRLPYRAAA